MRRYGKGCAAALLSILVLKIRQNIQLPDLARIGAEGMQLDIVGFKLIEETGSKALIEVDGGVNAETGAMLRDAGADVLVAGNYVFKSENPASAISLLRNL